MTLPPEDFKKVPVIRKRDGEVVKFDVSKIYNAVVRAFSATNEGGEKEAKKISENIFRDLVKIKKVNKLKEFTPNVEMIQDLVEEELIFQEYAKTAKAYILYREKRAEIRREFGAVPEKVRKLVSASKKYFKNPLSEFIFFRTYARWIEKEGRRETWIETVGRYIDFMKENLGAKLSEEEYEEVRQAILKQDIMPSMRLMQFAGNAARKTNVCVYNCSYTAPKAIQDFAEIVYLLMCGAGVGFSIESQNVQALPQIKKQTENKRKTFIVDDSREGWADALSYGMKAWYEGEDVDFDLSQLRPAGARLKTMGGKSSGPEPLRQLLDFTREKILKKQGRRLSNINAHDIICKIGECVVSGGVRRSALISLSDIDDIEMRDAKKGQFYLTDPQRSMANNSAVYNEKPEADVFMDEWIALAKSGSGERGIFNRGSLKTTMPKRRWEKNKDKDIQWGTNPCGEIILKPKQFCNLTEVVARAYDTKESLLRKTRLAVILGTYQSTLTNFPYLSLEWKKNCEEERLLGVSITGQWDCPAIRDEEALKEIKEEALKVNKEYAKKFKIPASASITCVKPSGTVSQLVDSASGMHPRHSRHYIRRVRISATDALFKMLRDQGIPYHPEVGQSADSAITYVLEFPVKAPRGGVFKDDISAIEQLKHWKMVKEHFTEHNPSITISVGDNEWIEVANWVYENWSLAGGLSFLPRSNHVYKLAPYEAVSKEVCEEFAKKVAHLDFSKIVTYEKEDETDIKKELACVAGLCEIT
ncbi:MAG: ribonucleoside-triphosphate reductase [Candidatus Pacebacteria bacterium]|nr:ribonucleoside-triphosphate reductase [Candidatus Paceibacterota bacterium]